MPYAHELAARLRDPGDFLRIVQLWEKASEGLRALGGPLKTKPDGGTVEQAIRFTADKWTVEKARKWLSDHDYKPLGVEPAAPPSEAADGTELVLACDGSMIEVLEAAAAGEDGKPKLPKLRIAAYNGGPMTVGFYGRVAIDLAGLEIPKGPIPILRDHDHSLIVGHGVAVSDGNRLTVEVEVSGIGEAAREVVEAGKRGFPWQASISVRPAERREIEAGAEIKVNGRIIEGPFTLIAEGRLMEVSVLPLGADLSTKTQVAAHTAKEAQMDSEMDSKKEKKEVESKPEPAAAKAPQAPPAVDAASAARDVLAAERTRIAAIEATCAGDWHGDDELAKKVVGIRAAALASGETVDSVNAKLVVEMRAARPRIGRVAIHSHEADSSPVTLEAALAVSAKISEKTLVAEYGEKVLESARRNFRGLRLREFIGAVCAMDGVELPGTFGSGAAWAKAAFSSLSLPGILGNVANKSLLDAYRALPSAARQIARISQVNDFKVHTRYRLGGNMQFEKVGAGGELPHGELSEQSFTQQAATYGKYFALTRQDVINDDLGAFLQIPQMIGRGAALALEEAAWTIILANASSFFGTGNANYATGAGSALGGTALTAAVALMENQTDPHGKPIVLNAKFLVVPPALRAVAERLFTSEKLVVTGGLTLTSTATLQEDANIHRSRYQPVVSPYISNAAITGHSTTRWYLVGDPLDVAFLEIAFLAGQDAPVVEAVEVPSDTAGGKGFRAYHDFGVALMDPRGAVMNDGA
jgi:hypothetical protein